MKKLCKNCKHADDDCFEENCVICNLPDTKKEEELIVDKNNVCENFKKRKKKDCQDYHKGKCYFFYGG